MRKKQSAFYPESGIRTELTYLLLKSLEGGIKQSRGHPLFLMVRLIRPPARYSAEV
jgi:hypothetical protein